MGHFLLLCVSHETFPPIALGFVWHTFFVGGGCFVGYAVFMSLIPDSSVDRRLLRSAARYESGEVMSERVLGQLTPAQCVERVRSLLSSRTVLDDVEERRLLLIGMAEHLEWLKEQRDNPLSWSAIARSYKLLSDQVERTNVNVGEVSTKLAEAHAASYVEGFVVGFNALLGELSRRGLLEVDAEDVGELVGVGVAESSRFLEARTVKSVDGVDGVDGGE